MKDDKKIKFGLVCMIIALVLIFIFNSFIGLFFSIAALILSICNLKTKNITVIITFIVSIFLIIFFIFSFIISFNFVNDMLSDAKLQSYEICEDNLEMDANFYVDNNEFDFEQNASRKIVLTKSELGDSCPSLKCDSYVIYDFNSGNAKAYISCDDYKTNGFNSKYLNN